MGNKIVLIGGGGHCKSVVDSALRMNCFDEIVITDTNLAPGKSVLGCKIAGPDECLDQLKKMGFDYAFVTVGCVKVDEAREKIAMKATALGFEFPTIIDPSASISDYSIIGEGTFVGKNAVVNADAKIGRHCIINSGAIIEHDCIVGDFTHVSVGTKLCGGACVGNNCFVGAGSTVIQQIKIGNNVLIGANSTILSEVGDGLKKHGIVKSTLT